MADRLDIAVAAPLGHVVALPSAATSPVRQPRGGACDAYRAAHPWPSRQRQPHSAAELEARAFGEALAMLRLTEARFDLAHAQIGWCRATGDSDNREEYWRGQEADAYFARKRAAELLAYRPAPDRRRLAQKVAAIGAWGLSDKTRWGDLIREGVRRDAVRLGVPEPAAPKARRR